MPHIRNIGGPKPSFHQGASIADKEAVSIDHIHDWYFTPAVSTGGRKSSDFGEQRVVWVDCDDTYDRELVFKLRPNFVWETSPGNLQAVWLLKDPVAATEFSRDGLLGLLASAIGADPSGVDISQLLRVPGSSHHKGKEFKGKILRASKVSVDTSFLLKTIALHNGFSRYLASELASDDPYGDRSKMIWKISRTAAELDLDKTLTYKILRACKWNKWRDEPERLRDDIDKAYRSLPSDKQPTLPDKAVEEPAEEPVVEEADPGIQAWDMMGVSQFSDILRKPMKWVIPGVIPEAGCGLIVAAPKVGKTRIAIEAALGLATGSRPLGRGIHKPVPVGFMSLEDGEYLFSMRLNESLNTEAGRKQFHWDGHIAKDLMWQPPSPMALHTSFEQIDLSKAEDKQRLYETIIKYELELIIIDTLSMAVGGANINSSSEMYAILKDVKAVAKETKCAVAFIHHTRKRVFDDGESIQEKVLGSTALHAWSDFILSLAPPKENSNELRLGVQTKMSTDEYLLDQELKIIPVSKSSDLP